MDDQISELRKRLEKLEIRTEIYFNKKMKTLQVWSNKDHRLVGHLELLLERYLKEKLESHLKNLTETDSHYSYFLYSDRSIKKKDKRNGRIFHLSEEIANDIERAILQDWHI